MRPKSPVRATQLSCIRRSAMPRADISGANAKLETLCKDEVARAKPAGLRSAFDHYVSGKDRETRLQRRPSSTVTQTSWMVIEILPLELLHKITIGFACDCRAVFEGRSRVGNGLRSFIHALTHSFSIDSFVQSFVRSVICSF